MDPINIIVGFNIIATFGANLGGARKGLKSTVVVPKEKPKTYLQKLPLVLAVISLLALIFAVFQIGTIAYSDSYFGLRIAALIIYLISSWLQIAATKTLGDVYSQDILILRNHRLVTKGLYKVIRHPQYLFQILMDLGGGIATMGYIVVVIAIAEIPILIMRASAEEKLLQKNFKDAFSAYKKKSGFMIPFIG